MQLLYQASTLLSILLFLFYGVRCLFSDGMVVEFERFGLSRYRRLTGGFEILGALGLAAGQFVHPVLLVSSAGLALLMALGVATRVRVRDPLVEVLPALVLGAMNLFILLTAAGLTGTGLTAAATG
ncbi:MAG: hypothetical protein EA350_14110 [Gemmatimonadales bacterium]|nr:MAG: hypothetical protein EA350_14110 [Gemmatimonadales bacterium]